MKNTGKVIILLFAATFGVGLLTYPQQAMEGVRGGLSALSSTLIPSLFPFMVLAAFLSGYGLLPLLSRPFRPLERLLNMPKNTGSLLLISAIGGYPVAARTVGSMVRSGQLPVDKAERMLCFLVNASPSFLIGTIGAGLFGSAQLGTLLVVSTLAASFIIALVTRGGKQTDSQSAYIPTVHLPFTQALVGAVSDAASGMLILSGFVLLFRAITALLTACGLIDLLAGILSTIFPASPAFLSALLAGILEITSGCILVAEQAGSSAPLWIAALCGFASLSIHCQILAGLSGSGIRPTKFLLSRPVHALLSAVILFSLLHFFPIEAQAFANGSIPVPQAFSVSAPASIAMLMLGVFCLLGKRDTGDDWKKRGGYATIKSTRER